MIIPFCFLTNRTNIYCSQFAWMKHLLYADESEMIDSTSVLLTAQYFCPTLAKYFFFRIFSALSVVYLVIVCYVHHCLAYADLVKSAMFFFFSFFLMPSLCCCGCLNVFCARLIIHICFPSLCRHFHWFSNECCIVTLLPFVSSVLLQL